MNRRGFLRSLLLGAATAAVAPHILVPKLIVPARWKVLRPDPAIRYFYLSHDQLHEFLAKDICRAVGVAWDTLIINGMPERGESGAWIPGRIVMPGGPIQMTYNIPQLSEPGIFNEYQIRRLSPDGK